MIADDIREIKHLFFTYRNGEIADTLRKAGMPYRMIFGLQIPQLADIARKFGQSKELAEALWKDSEVRESRILATYIYPPEEVDMASAIALSHEIATREEADMMAFRLFRRLPYAGDLLIQLEKDTGHPFPYISQALKRNLQ